MRRKPAQPGDVYGQLTVIEEARRIEHTRRVYCACACGNPRTLVNVRDLQRGHATSCGCVRQANMRALNARGLNLHWPRTKARRAAMGLTA